MESVEPETSRSSGSTNLMQRTMTSLQFFFVWAGFDEGHEESAAYYLNHTVPIESEDDIPTGRRACYIHVFQCGNCTNRLISVVDFLKVRDQFVVKGGDTYPYEDFKSYIETRS